MTTILADLRLGVIVADTSVSDGSRSWPNMRKVWRIRGELIGFAGDLGETILFRDWLGDGATGRPPVVKSTSALVLTASGLFLCTGSTTRIPSQCGYDAIGTGAAAALAAYDAQGFKNPERAVRIAAKYDAASRAPVRTYTFAKG